MGKGAGEEKGETKNELGSVWVPHRSIGSPVLLLGVPKLPGLYRCSTAAKIHCSKNNTSPASSAAGFAAAFGAAGASAFESALAGEPEGAYEKLSLFWKIFCASSVGSFFLRSRMSFLVASTSASAMAFSRGLS